MSDGSKKIPVILTAGYRSFFPLAALSAALMLGYWVMLVTGIVGYLPSRFSPSEWHQHEMIFGTVGAIIVGFLFTAVPNWTGRPTPTGTRLAGLVILWILGRVAVFYGALLPSWIPLVLDGLFLPLAILGIVSALLGAKNKRNYFLPVVLSIFALLNFLSHCASLGWIELEVRQIFIAAVLFIVFLMNVIGGRIIPSFTGNKYPHLKSSAPALLLPLSVVSIFSLAGAFLLNAENMVIGGIAFVAGIATLGRALSWHGWKVVKDPLLVILHIGYLWIPAGFFLLAYYGFSDAGPVSHALHAFTVGAVGSLTLGVMSRATLGHSGLPLNNEALLTVMFVIVNIAALARVILPMVNDAQYIEILQGAGLLWAIAYLLFLIRFVPICFKPRKLF